MALVRIDYCEERDHLALTSFGEKAKGIINQVMSDVLNVPMSENFVIVQTNDKSNLLHNPLHVNLVRLASIVFIQITLNVGRSPELKATFYDVLTDVLNKQLGVPRSDVFINLIEVAKENWSFGRSAR